MSCGRRLHLCTSSCLAASDGATRAAAEAPRAEGNKIGTPCVAEKKGGMEVGGSCIIQTHASSINRKKATALVAFGSQCPSA